MTRRRRGLSLLAGALLASSLTGIAGVALAPSAGAAPGDPVSVSTACQYRPFDGKFHQAEVAWAATPSVTTVANGGAISLSGTTVKTTLSEEMAQIGYQAGYLKAGANSFSLQAWLTIESVNATPRYQVVQANGTGTTTITPTTGGGSTATPIQATFTLPDTNWTATATGVSFRPASAGAIAGQIPTGPLPGDKTGGVKGGQYVVATLVNDQAQEFDLTLDCYPGTVDWDANPTANYAPAPFATVGNVDPTDPTDPTDPEEPEEPEQPVAGDWDCISGLGRYRQREVEPTDIKINFPSVPQTVNGRVVLPKVRAEVTLDDELNLLLYRANLVPVGQKTLPLESWIYLSGSNTSERTQRVKVDTTWTSNVTDPTPENKTSGDETANPIVANIDFGPVWWTPVSNGDVTFTLAAPNGNSAPKIDVIGRGYADTPYSIRPYGQLFMRAGTLKADGVSPNYGANLDCVAGSVTVADTTIPYHNFGNQPRNAELPNTDPSQGSRGRYAIVADELGVIGKTTFGDTSQNTYDCISGLGRYRQREIEPMAIKVRQPEAAVVSGGKVRVPSTLVDVTIPSGLLKLQYQGNQLVNGTQTYKLFGWVYLNATNTVERTKRVAVETVYQVTVNDPTPENKGNFDESIAGFTQTLDFGSTSWTPVGRGDVVFSLATPGGNSAPTINVIGKGYADTPYTVRPYGNVFLRAETANYGANFDCVAGKVAIANTEIPFHNFGNYVRNPDNNLASGSRGRYSFTPTADTTISKVLYGDPSQNTFECISGLGRYRGREIEPFKLAVSFPDAPVVDANEVTVPGVKLDLNVTSGLLKSLYAAGQYDNAALATEFTSTQKLEGWVYVEGVNTVEKTQRLYLDTTYDVVIKDPTPENKTNSDETISAIDKTLTFGESSWTAAGPSKVTFRLAAPNQDDAPKIDVIGTGYADTPYSIRPFGNVFLRAGTDHYGANLDCSSGKVTIADATIPYHNFGNDPRDTTDNLKSGMRGRYAFAPVEKVFGTMRTGTANQRYVNAVFKNQLVLNRAVDPSGLAYWSGKLDKGMSRAAFTKTVTTSAEARRLWVREQFRTILGREADQSGVTYWSNKLGSGTTYQAVQAQLLGSNEFRTKAGGTNFGVVDSLFDKVLRRAATDQERADWSAKLSTKSQVAVAAELLASLDAKKVIVDDSFVLILGRAADASGKNYWAGKLQSGTPTQTLLAQLLASNEFANRAI